MKQFASLVSLLLLAAWAGMPAQAALATAEKTRTTAAAAKKPLATSKANAGVKAKTGIRAKAKAKAKSKSKSRAKARPNTRAKAAPANKTRSGPVVAARAPVPATPASPAPSPVSATGTGQLDEAALDADIASARRLVTAHPADAAARQRLAQAAIRLIEGVLQAEARGDSAKAAHLVHKLTSDLPDVGWRVQNMAQKGDVKARQAAGFLLGRGVLLEKSPGKSCAEFIAAAARLATAGWDAAQCQMEAEPEKAWAQMDRAAGQGHAAAQEWMGRRCLGEFGATGKDYACARDYLTRSASQGRTRAQTLLAYLLINGHGGGVDLARGLKLYRMAAEQGDAHAQNNLGEILETGSAGSSDPEQAVHWYERAAESGLGPAQFNAGRLLAVGIGKKKDPVKARTLLIQAEAKGIAQARQVLEWLDRQAAAEPDPAAPGRS